MPKAVVLAAALAAPAAFGGAFAAGSGARDCAFTEPVRAIAVAAEDARTLTLGDGRRVRLAGIDAPASSRGALAKLAAGKEVELGLSGRGADRHGRLLAQVFAGGAWVQGAMVEAGAARVHTRDDTRRCASALLRREAAARAKRRGIWADEAYRVLRAEEAAGFAGSFQIVEGKVLSVRRTRERTYANFGSDWRSDFTIAAGASARRRMAKDGLDMSSWEGRRVRVRGWIAVLNGPVIEVTHAEQVEVVE